MTLDRDPCLVHFAKLTFFFLLFSYTFNRECKTGKYSENLRCGGTSTVTLGQGGCYFYALLFSFFKYITIVIVFTSVIFIQILLRLQSMFNHKPTFLLLSTSHKIFACINSWHANQGKTLGVKSICLLSRSLNSTPSLVSSTDCVCPP